MENKNVYRCYSELLKNFLIENGASYFLVARDIVTNQKFYAFEKTHEFFEIFRMWEKNNPKNKI